MFSSLVVVGFHRGSLPLTKKQTRTVLWSVSARTVGKAMRYIDVTFTDFLSQIDDNSAAELATPVTKLDVLAHLQNQEKRMATSSSECPVKKKEALKMQSVSHLFRQPERLHDGYLQRLDQLQLRLKTKVREHGFR